MLRLKSCPRCKNGDITLDRDYYGWYQLCIQCGYMRDLIIIVERKREKDQFKKYQRTAARSSVKGSN